jgi:hypothetical protein
VGLFLCCFAAVSLRSAAEEMWQIFCLLHNDNTAIDATLPEYRTRSLLLQFFYNSLCVIALSFVIEQQVTCVYELMMLK